MRSRKGREGNACELASGIETLPVPHELLDDGCIIRGSGQDIFRCDLYMLQHTPAISGARESVFQTLKKVGTREWCCFVLDITPTPSSEVNNMTLFPCPVWEDAQKLVESWSMGSSDGNVAACCGEDTACELAVGI